MSTNENHQNQTDGLFKIKSSSSKQKDRIKKGIRIVSSSKNNVIEISAHEWDVRSESDENKLRRVRYDDGYDCTCEDHLYRNNKPGYDGCGHINSVKLYIKLKPQKLSVPQINDSNNLDSSCFPPAVLKCNLCDSIVLIKYGTHLLKSGIRKQKYHCCQCGYTFVFHIDGFEYMMYDPSIVMQGLNLVFSGLSYRKAARHIFITYGKKVNHATLIFWVRKHTKNMLYFTDQLRPLVSDILHADELDLKVKDCVGIEKGKYMYMWNVYDDDTKFWLSTHISQPKTMEEARIVFRKAKALMNSYPKKIITDGYPGYPSAIDCEFPRKDILSPPTTKHVVYVDFKHAINNNCIERLHNEIREKTRTMRGAGNADSAKIFAEAIRIFHNFLREHSSLQNRTPAEAAGIDLKLGQNKLYSLLRISGKKYNEDHKFIIFLRKKKLLRHVKIEDKDGHIFVISKSRHTDETWLKIFNVMKKFDFEYKKIENKMMWVKPMDSEQSGSEGNHDGN